MMDIAQIMKVLPHRYPLLLVDRILELVPGEKVIGIKNVTINEQFFTGHFPGHPVMPGVLILESMAQVAGILAFAGSGTLEEIEQEMADKVIYFMSIDKVKFRRPVVPGDQLRQEITLLRHRGKIVSFEGKAYVGNDMVAEAEMKAMLIDRQSEGDYMPESKATRIDPKAVIMDGANLDQGVEVGPFSVIGKDVRIGAGTIIGPHVVIEGRTTIGSGNRIFQFASVGAIPQDLKYAGEDSELVIGDRNQIRECATLHRGTAGGGMATVVGDDNLIMAYGHVAHDCRLGNRVIMANAATLAGHVTIEDHSIIAGLAGVHQFCRVGRHAFVSAASVVVKDVPPFTTVQGDRAKLAGLNLEGLKRKGLTGDQISNLKRAYRLLFRSGLVVEEALARVVDEIPDDPNVRYLAEFVTASERGVTR